MSNIKFGKVANNPDTASANIAPAIEMGISNAPTRLIVKYITDMYSYPLEAAIRETISNAIDAATTAGHGIEGVHAEIIHPEEYASGMFCVRDNGAGMTCEKLVNVYTQYGVSDKREDEDATGAFGLGAKSPLAYTNEFHIITKTADEGCHYVHCYRTPADDFLADPPVKVNGTIEIADNLATLSGDKRNIVVEDPFAENETGTVIKFPIRYSDLKKADGVLASIDRLFYNTGEGSITDTEYEYAPLFYDMGSLTIADDDGDSIDANIYLLDNSITGNERTYGRREIRDVVERLFKDGGNDLELDMVAFKVGDWLYPADGSAWKYSDYSCCCAYPSRLRVIVDVPSKALPFIPSRDTIRSDKTSNASGLCSVISEKVRADFSDKAKFTEIVNWVGENDDTYTVTLNRIFPFRSYEIDEAAMKAGTLRATCGYSHPEFTIDIDLNKLNAPGGYTVAELYDMPPVMMGFMEGFTNPKMKNGPIAVPNNIASMMLGVNVTLKGRGSALAGYDLTRSKKCADDLIGEGYVANPAAEIKMAYKDTQHKVDRHTWCKMTCCFPAGTGLVNGKTATVGARKQGALMIVDGSRYGLSKIRTGINRAFAAKSIFNEVAPIGMFCVIPPKTADENDNWTDGEIKEQVDALTRIGNDLFDKVVYIPADEVEGALAKTKENGISRSERSELDRMFNVNRVLTMVDRNADSYHSAFGRSSSYAKVEGLGAKIAADPSSWGVIIADKAYSQAYVVAYEYARAAFALDIVPEKITHIACIGSNHYNEKRAELLNKEGVTVIYDESNQTPFETVADAGSFRYTNKVAYSGRVPEDIQMYLDMRNANKSDDNIQSMWRNKFGGYNYWRSHDEKLDISRLVEMFTFGHEHYTSAFTAGEIILSGWVTDIVQSSINFENAAAGEGTLERLENILNDILGLWRARFDQASIQLDTSSMTNASAVLVVEIGKTLGVDKDVEAYYAGVPAADIIA